MVGSLAVWPLYKRQVSHLCGKTMYQLAQELRKKTRIADIHSDLESARELGWEPVSAANVRDQSPHASGFYLFSPPPLKVSGEPQLHTTICWMYENMLWGLGGCCFESP